VARLRQGYDGQDGGRRRPDLGVGVNSPLLDGWNRWTGLWLTVVSGCDIGSAIGRFFEIRGAMGMGHGDSPRHTLSGQGAPWLHNDGNRAGRPTTRGGTPPVTLGTAGYLHDRHRRPTKRCGGLGQHAPPEAGKPTGVSGEGGDAKNKNCKTNPNLCRPVWKIPKNEPKNEPKFRACCHGSFPLQSRLT